MPRTRTVVQPAAIDRQARRCAPLSSATRVSKARCGRLPMSSEHNNVARLCEQFAAAYNAHDLSGLLAMYAGDAEVQVPDQAEPLRGKAAISQYFQAQFDAVPDVHVELSK